MTPSVAPNVVQEGSTMIVRLDDTLDTRKLQPGKHFKAKLAEDMVGPTGAVLVPRGKNWRSAAPSRDFRSPCSCSAIPSEWRLTFRSTI